MTSFQCLGKKIIQDRSGNEYRLFRSLKPCFGEGGASLWRILVLGGNW